MRRRFQPSESWTLEDRIALSNAADPVEVTALDVSTVPLQATFHGHVTTTIHGGVDTISQDAVLTGTSRVSGAGAVNLAGEITNNWVNLRNFPDVGTLTLTSKTHAGTLTLSVTGPHSNLAPTSPTTVHLTFSITKATGQYASYQGHTGTADLTMVTKGPAGLHLTRVNHGTFTLALTVK